MFGGKTRLRKFLFISAIFLIAMSFSISSALADTTMEDLIGPNRVVPLPPLNPHHIPIASPDSDNSVNEPVTVYPTPTQIEDGYHVYIVPPSPEHIPRVTPTNDTYIEPVTVYPTPTPTRTPTLSEKFSNSNSLFPLEPVPVITPSQSLFSNRISRISQSPADIPSQSESSTLCLSWILNRIQAFKDRAAL